MTSRCLTCRTLISRGSRCGPCDSARRGNGTQRQRFREVVLERDGYRCVLCGAAVGPLEADHIVPLASGGPAHDPANGRTLCRPCHLARRTT